LPTFNNELGKDSRNYSTEYEEGTDYGSACGTSMAAPLVTGAIGLIIKHFKSNNLSYSSDFIEKVLKSSSIKIKSEDSNDNKILNLERLAWTLEQIHEVKAEDQGIDLQKSFKTYLNETFINLFLEDYKSSLTFKSLLESLENKSLSIYSLNSKLINTQEYSKMPTKELDLRIAMNIVGKQLTPNYKKLYVTSLLETANDTKIKKVALDNVLDSLLLTREALANMKERGVFGYPVYPSDVGKSPEEIEKLEYKRVELAEKYRTKNLRSPNTAAIQQILLEAEEAIKQEALPKTTEPQKLGPPVSMVTH
jgi:subtilisin family serine protease